MLTRSRFNQAVDLLTMRGVVVGTARADAVYRAVERTEGVSWSAIFDGLRSAGAAIPFGTERGVVQTIQAADTERAARNAREAETLRRRQLAFDNAPGPRSFTDSRRVTIPRRNVR